MCVSSLLSLLIFATNQQSIASLPSALFELQHNFCSWIIQIAVNTNAIGRATGSGSGRRSSCDQRWIRWRCSTTAGRINGRTRGRWWRCTGSHIETVVLCRRQSSPPTRTPIPQNTQTPGQIVSARKRVERSYHQSADVSAARLRPNGGKPKIQNHSVVQRPRTVECKARHRNVC